MADRRVDDYAVYHAKNARPVPVRVTMGSGDHLSPVQFSGQVEKVPDHVVGPDNPVHQRPGEWYGQDESETR